MSDLLLDDLIDTRKGRRRKVASERVQRQVGERKKEIQDEEASPQTHRPDPDFEVTTSREKEPIVSRMEGYARDEVGVLRGETNVDQLRAFLFFVVETRTGGGEVEKAARLTWKTVKQFSLDVCHNLTV